MTTAPRVDLHNRCIAYLLCESALLPDFASLQAAMEARFPALIDGMELLSSDLFEGSGYAFVVGGVPLSLIVVPAPLPRTEWEVGAAANLAWPKAAELVGAHRAHIIVSPIAAISDQRDALVKHTILTAVGAVVAKIVGTSGICWTPAFTLIESAALQSLAGAMMVGSALGVLPLDLWMRLDFGRVRDGYAVMTNGLKSLIDIEIVVTSSDKSPHRQGAIAYDVAAYLIRNGMVLNDGDTLETNSGKILARTMPHSNLLQLQQIGSQ